MLNKLWPIFILISISYGIISGKTSEINNAIFESAESAVSLSVTLLGTVCLWSGIMEIASNTKLIDIINKALGGLMKIIFPEIKKEDREYKEITMNITANILGLGNAATPLGLKAMKTMQERNEDKQQLSNSMAMLIIINTASLQVIPTTVIAVRSSLSSVEPTKIILPVWISTICAAVAGIVASKVFIKMKK